MENEFIATHQTIVDELLESRASLPCQEMGILSKIDYLVNKHRKIIEVAEKILRYQKEHGCPPPACYANNREGLFYGHNRMGGYINFLNLMGLQYEH